MRIILTVGEIQLGKKRLDWEKVVYRPLFMLANTLMSCIKCTAASHPASCPRHSCKFPTACYSMKHSSNIHWCRPGFLSRGTSLLAINVSSDVVLFGNSILLMWIYLIKSAIALQRLDVQQPNTFDVKIFLHPSASNPDGPDPPLVYTAAFLTNFSFMLCKIIWWITGGSPLISVSSQTGFDWVCFCFKKLSVVSSRGRLPLVIGTPQQQLRTLMPHWCFLLRSVSEIISKRQQYFLDHYLMLASVEWFQLLIINI